MSVAASRAAPARDSEQDLLDVLTSGVAGLCSFDLMASCLRIYLCEEGLQQRMFCIERHAC